jgi:hypothetical protein
MAGTPGTLEKRFWAKVEKLGPDDCWPWLANKNNKGYGMIRQGGTLPKIPASRASYLINNGPIPFGLEVMHVCDNPGCVNPKHLIVGTHLQNMLDKMAKGRHRYGLNPNPKLPIFRGEEHYSTKFTDEQVRSFRKRMADGMPCRALAREVGCHPSTMRRIRDKITWAHVL